jgi:hypothetical protein
VWRPRVRVARARPNLFCFPAAAFLLLLYQADSRCTPQELANLIWAFAKADFPMTTLLEEVLQQPAVVKQ